MYYSLFRWFPKSALTRVAGFLADVPWPQSLLRTFIRFYVRTFAIDMSQFAAPAEGYKTFNAFFTREVAPGARPIPSETDALLSPVDGRVIEAGPIRDGQLLQAKGITYSLGQLLGNDPGWKHYDGGAFATLYLHPRDYHRIHSPCTGKVTRFRYIPGDLWTVSPTGVTQVPGLFARNERWITFMQTSAGEVAVVKVGATIVGRIRVVYHKGVGHSWGAEPIAESLPVPVSLKAGAELGRFELGSTVILLTRPGEADWLPLKAGDPVRMGARIGSIKIR
jgi:phosphatidylserine decarboxylase